MMQGGRKGMVPPLRWCVSELIIADKIVSVLSESLQILADLCGSICSCFR